jgi:hypothetical protein
LPVDDFLPGVQSVCSLGQEIPVPVGNGGSIDNLLLTDDGHLVVIETKLRRNNEANRAVVAQALQYGMGISELALSDLENCIRRGQKGCASRLGPDETIAERARKYLATADEDFEDRLDVLRRRGEILLLIVADGVLQSAERLVSWMNDAVGNRPIKLGVVELQIYCLNNESRLVVPRTLVRIREASRHVVAIELVNIPQNQVQVKVTGDHELPSTRVVAPPPRPLSLEDLIRRVRANNSEEIASVVESLISQLNASGLALRGLPSCVQYGVVANDGVVPLVSLGPKYVAVQIPSRAARALGEERFVACKQRINDVATFYRPEDVPDPAKVFGLSPQYPILIGKVPSFVAALVEIAEEVQKALRNFA